MKILVRIISLCLAFCLLLTASPLQAAAQEFQSDAEESLYRGEDHYTSEADMDNDALYTAYAEQLFYGGISLYGTAAGDTLTGDNKIIYDTLVPILRQIANGERTNTTITIGQEINYQGECYPVDAEVTFTGKDISGSQLSVVISALLSDLPYECYWYDKSIGCYFSWFTGSESLLQVTLSFSVAENYRGADSFTANTAKTSLPKHSLNNAQLIVNRYASASDYEKLLGYKNEICSLVTYDHEAADNIDQYHDTIDPWQMISVFDGDPSTNVVCEGYSKAFQYLCDLTTFSRDITCYCVSGYINGGPHMWNVVDIGGKHYLTDVTNSDSGTVGYDGSLFLTGASGSIAAGYKIAGCRFTYNINTIALWGKDASSILTLESVPYDPNNIHTEVTIPGKPATCTEDGLTNGSKCSVCGTVFKQQEVIPATGHSYKSKVTKPTCTQDGYTTHACSCGDSYTDAPVAAPGHQMGIWVTTAEPTCSLDGTRERICTREGCGHAETDPIPATGAHIYTDDQDTTCNICGEERDVEIFSVPMHRMYDPNSGEHFYTGAAAERDFLVANGWHYEGVGFNFPNEGAPVYRLYEPVYGEHLYTMDKAEVDKLIRWGWSYEGVAFNSAGEGEVPQYRLHNPNAKRGGYHFTGSPDERDLLISFGWISQGIGWYSCKE